MYTVDSCLFSIILPCFLQSSEILYKLFSTIYSVGKVCFIRETKCVYLAVLLFRSLFYLYSHILCQFHCMRSLRAKQNSFCRHHFNTSGCLRLSRLLDFPETPIRFLYCLFLLSTKLDFRDSCALL